LKKSFKYRLYPNKAQRQIIEKNLSFCGFLYNCALEERISFYKKFGKGIGYGHQSAQLPAIKAIFKEETSTVYAQSLQQVLIRLQRSFENFFRRVKEGTEAPGFPRFKRSKNYKTIIFPQTRLNGHGIILLDNKKLKIFGIPGEVKVKWHRPYQGKIKQAIIKKQGDQFYLILSCDEIETKQLEKTDKTIGFDLGLTSYITLDNGETILSQKPYYTAKEKIALLNQKLARKQNKSNNERRARKELTKTHQKVFNIRQDFLHKLSTNIIKQNDIIILEDLKVREMLIKNQKDKIKKERKEARERGEPFKALPQNSNIADAAWGYFATMLEYKAENAGRKVIKVDPKNSSKECSSCGNIKTQEEQTLTDRHYDCGKCGLSIGRDHNSAIVIKKRGIKFLEDKGLGNSLATDNKVSEATL
jgi:putative transposase